MSLDTWFGDEVARADPGLQAGFVLPTANTVTAVRAALLPTPAGTRCALMNATGDITAGVWESDGAGSSVCRQLDYGLVNDTMVTVGVDDTFDVEISVGSSVVFSAAGATLLAGVTSIMVHHLSGLTDVARVNDFECITSQTVTPGTLVDGVMCGGGFHMPLNGGSPVVVASVLNFLATFWRPATARNVWPAVTLNQGAVTTFDTVSQQTCCRSPRDGPTGIRCDIQANTIGDTVGPITGNTPIVNSATDGWSQVVRVAIPANFYEPLTSDLTYTVKKISFLG